MVYNTGMGYIGKTFAYLKKAFPLLAAIMIVPAVIMAFFMRPISFITFLPEYFRTDVRSFLDVLWLIFDRYTLTYVYPIFIMFVLLVVAFSIGLSIIEKHFRVGRLMLKAPMNAVNNSIFPVAENFFILFLVYLASNFLFVCIVTLSHFLISGAGRVVPLDFIVTAFLALILFFLLMRLVQSAFLWAPVMLVFGYTFLDAVITASSLSAKAPFKLYRGIVFPFVCVMAVQSLVVFLRSPPWVNITVAAVCYLFLCVYTAAVVMIVVFDLSGMERRDLKKLY